MKDTEVNSQEMRAERWKLLARKYRYQALELHDYNTEERRQEFIDYVENTEFDEQLCTIPESTMRELDKISLSVPKDPHYGDILSDWHTCTNCGYDKMHSSANYCAWCGLAIEWIAEK